ncbi:MAG: endonuclease/exonuclease/phosphatase family protein [Treponema sp.]|jgi:endonuclease/exonuclease/phosphatase family metal-dependent hydrolase|nr:endonuclease/exonuclease/phosphatase family protein [Treponema sp.]
MKKIFKRCLTGLAIAAGSIILLAGAFLGILTIAEYKPGEMDKLEVKNHSTQKPSGISTGVPLSVLTWNIGYASLDESQDFFMDGGKGVRPPNDSNVRRNLSGIRDFIFDTDFDIALIQEIDIASKRSYYIDQRSYLTENFSGNSAFAHNFNSIFVPIPFPEFIGRVSSGLLTLNRAATVESFRMSLPNPFSWPVRAVNLKRCLLISRIPLENASSQLVIVNLHLEAYDSGGGDASAGREAQTKAMLNFLYAEYAKGNYCIAGGDFNQNFPGIDPQLFSLRHSDYFTAGTLSPSLLYPGWQYASDTRIPSCRLLNEPYSGDLEKTQFYIIDGFVLSPNVELTETQAFDLGFKYSDHNPVKIRVVLR